MVSLHHWRDQRGWEIDILAESDHSLAATAVNPSTSVSRGDFRQLQWFAGEGSGKTRNVTSIIYYLGEQKLLFENRLYAVPVSCLWG